MRSCYSARMETAVVIAGIAVIGVMLLPIFLLGGAFKGAPKRVKGADKAPGGSADSGKGQGG
jgi:hypothetical protein